MGFTTRQWLVLIVFAFAYLFSACVCSLPAPFYPAEAERKGAVASEYGLVFGIFQLVMFILSPIYGKYMGKLGPKNVFNVGLFTTGTACFLFGFLDKLEGHLTFIILSFVTRILEAMGSAAYVTASFTIIACEFPDAISTTFASMETFFGLGLIVGPLMGGALYELGGYVLPFATTGTLLFLVGIATFFLLPDSSKFNDPKVTEVEGYGVWSILKIPGVSLAAFDIFMGALTTGFLAATLEPHMRQFDFSPMQTGLIFIISGGFYAMTSPIWGWICDRVMHPVYVAICSASLMVIAFTLIGPAPFIPSKTKVWLSCVGLIIHGCGLGAAHISAFILALRETIEHGFPDNVSTYSVVSGLWTSMLALGLFTGPSVAGFLIDHFGFRLGSLFPMGMATLVLTLASTFAVFGRRRHSGFMKSHVTGPEAEKLLNSNQLFMGQEYKMPEPKYGATIEILHC